MLLKKKKIKNLRKEKIDKPESNPIIEWGLLKGSTNLRGTSLLTLR